MPRLTRWPRDAKGAPMHLLAQICCADLPEALWNGLGPRKGWLLFFIEVPDLKEYDGEDRNVQVLHTLCPGSLRQLPDEAASVRYSMIRDGYYHNIRPGAQKFWRKWPVDIVEQEHDQVRAGNDENDGYSITAEELYGAVVSQYGVYDEAINPGRMMTWRGMRYFAASIMKDLQPDSFKSYFISYLGLLEPPETDEKGFEEELEKRAGQHPEIRGRDVGRDRQAWAVKDTLRAELKQERRTGWLERAYPVIDAKIAEAEFLRDRTRKELDDKGKGLSEYHRGQKKRFLSYQIETLETLSKSRADLDTLLTTYSGPDDEARLNAEIEITGQECLAWGARLEQAARDIMLKAGACDPETAITEQDWDDLTRPLTEASPLHWDMSYHHIRLSQNSRSYNFNEHIRSAVREDLLDIYTRDNVASVSLPNDLLHSLEASVRRFDPYLPNRMGNPPDLVQSRILDEGDYLLFQATSDLPIGWMWGDAGALYVTISENDLRKGEFENIKAWIEGH